jgi:hypothetical protein
MPDASNGPERLSATSSATSKTRRHTHHHASAERVCRGRHCSSQPASQPNSFLRPTDPKHTNNRDDAGLPPYGPPAQRPRARLHHGHLLRLHSARGWRRRQAAGYVCVRGMGVPFGSVVVEVEASPLLCSSADRIDCSNAPTIPSHPAQSCGACSSRGSRGRAFGAGRSPGSSAASRRRRAGATPFPVRACAYGFEGNFVCAVGCFVFLSV